MVMSVNSISGISFTGRYDDDKVTAGEIGVVGGATVGGAKYGIGSLKKLKNAKNLNSVDDLIKLSQKTTANVQKATNASKGVKALWTKMGANAREYTQAIMKWAKSTATGKLAKRIVSSKAFGKASAVVGGAGAMFVFVSGLGEMGTTYSKMVQKPDYLEA